MAKKKESKKTVSISENESMKNKVEIRQPISPNQERVSRIVGTVFIGLGILLVSFGIFSYIKFREEPLLNPEFEAPTFEESTTITSGDNIKINGMAKGYDTVFIYKGEEKIGETKVKDDSKFTFDYPVEEEGEYALTIAGVKGFPNRNISPQSEPLISVVDRTAPDQKAVTMKYGSETNKDTFILVGTTEANATIEVKRGTESFDGLSNKEGEFRIEEISLDEGKNVFSIYIKDVAGNQTQLDEKVRVTYSPAGDINGDAVVDENIPQASGVFDELIGNNLMMMFGLLALLVFIGSSVMVYNRNRK